MEKFRTHLMDFLKTITILIVSFMFCLADHDVFQTQYFIPAYFTLSVYLISVFKDEDNKYPYIARATMCYFPECSRTQGVDYTNRELSLRFQALIRRYKNNDKNFIHLPRHLRMSVLEWR